MDHRMNSGPPTSQQQKPSMNNGMHDTQQGGSVMQQPMAANNMMGGAQGLPPHLMGLMTDSAFAAAASGTSLFPPTAMLSNPGAFMFGMQMQQQAVNMHQQMDPRAMTNQMYPGGQATSNGSATMHDMTPFTQTSFMEPSGGTHSDNASLADSKNDSQGSRRELTADERAKQSRDRNREHARSTRLRKKAYVQKLKELVEGLHAERTEDVRQRRVAIQHLAEMQNVRREVVRSFLKLLSNYETDTGKWATILEDNFWLKQPVTPYRSFPRAEIEQECRITRGIDAMVCESASLAVMTEGIGSRSFRWMQIKREEFLQLEESKRSSKNVPRCISQQDSRLHHAVSSLSSSSGSGASNQASSCEDSEQQKTRGHLSLGLKMGSALDCNSDRSPSVTEQCKEGGSEIGMGFDQEHAARNDLHDYHAKPLPDPKLDDSEDSPLADEESHENSRASSNGDTKRISTDSFSGDDSTAALATHRPTKFRKTDIQEACGSSSGKPLPPNIAKKGGIPHNIRPTVTSIGNGNARLNTAPAIPLPPFAGIGKKSTGGISLSASSLAAAPGANVTESGLNEVKDAVGPNVISSDIETSSNSSKGSGKPQIRVYYHINEDDMILMEDVLMCPYVFRSQDAVVCGALSECVMPGMLRANFSSRNKLMSLELVYDAMGFMQQLERASGNDGSAQIIPGSLEMALAPTNTEARVITLAESPFLIVNVNEVWTRTTGYTQMEVEGQEYLNLLEGEGTVPEATIRAGKPPHKLEEVAIGRPACSTNIHYDKQGRDYIEFVCSYPLTNANNEITHLLHVSKELPSYQESSLATKNVT